ncbi:putative Phenylalanine--tRNA ligase beta subunit [Blattamonas nauphoetae]|uniref:phenylalanine--tRNA ligase n=1 Tax=Blattamonas nauphoetae TaxID=2049346 RepID=A0ABQ9Y447_9EUKA|nr:putative Phenylalanine--tRNA ligase beta subunit [Blattamonas nauphoetae]
MPHVLFSKIDFLKAIEEPQMTDEEIADLFAKLGMEAEVRQPEEGQVDAPSEPEIELEYTANRFDLSGMDGAVMEVRCFLGKDKPVFLDAQPATIDFVVDDNLNDIRPFAIGAIMRGLRLDEKIFKRFIDLQEKLHENACRRRTLVAIGTHDLETVVPPFKYSGEDPRSFSFIPLKTTLHSPTVDMPEEGTLNRTAQEWFDYYEANKLPLGKYIPIVKNLPLVPVIRDSKGVLMSLPPIVNGEHTKCVATRTKDIFIDMTGTDLTRLTIVMNTFLTLFSKHCDSIERVNIINKHSAYGGSPTTFPRLVPYKMDVTTDFINGLLGININTTEICGLLSRKQVVATEDDKEKGLIHCLAPAHRADIIHPADLAEDVMIAYGVDKITGIHPPIADCGVPLLSEEVTATVRTMASQGGYIEMYNFTLSSLAENSLWMNRPTCACEFGEPDWLRKDAKPIGTCKCRCGLVTTLNGKSADTECVRSSLIPSLFRSLRTNSAHSKPICLFEVGDVVVPDLQGCGGSVSFLANSEKCGDKAGCVPSCAGICGGGCCASKREEEGTVAVAPSKYVSPGFEEPNALGTVRSDIGTRNERRLSALRGGPDVMVEEMIPFAAHVFKHFGFTFVSADENIPALIEANKKNNKSTGVWQMIPISQVSRKCAKDGKLSGSCKRWLTDTNSFVQGNVTMLTLTDTAAEPPIISEPVGVMGVVRPDVVRRFGMQSVVVVALEVNIETLYHRLI